MTLSRFHLSITGAKRFAPVIVLPLSITGKNPRSTNCHPLPAAVTRLFARPKLLARSLSSVSGEVNGAVSFAGRAQATTLTTLREDDDAAPDGALRHAADGVKGYQREGHRRRETLDKYRRMPGT